MLEIVDQEVADKVITVKWVDTNKGDPKNPEYRSRLVAREFGGMDMGVSSRRPPLEAKKALLSMLATKEARRKRWSLSLVDVARAYLNASVKRATYVVLPAELQAQYPGKVARLKKCMYGARDAAQ